MFARPPPPFDYAALTQLGRPNITVMPFAGKPVQPILHCRPGEQQGRWKPPPAIMPLCFTPRYSSRTSIRPDSVGDFGALAPGSIASESEKCQDCQHVRSWGGGKPNRPSRAELGHPPIIGCRDLRLPVRMVEGAPCVFPKGCTASVVTSFAASRNSLRTSLAYAGHSLSRRRWL